MIAADMKSNGRTETFGDWLRRKRAEARLSGPDLALRSGVSKQYISNLEKNMRQPISNELVQPSREKVDALARGLGVSVAEARLAAGYAPPDRPDDTELTIDMILPSGYEDLDEAARGGNFSATLLLRYLLNSL